MAYNTKSIVTDKDGNPISQYYNPATDSYEPVEGSHGANKVMVGNNDLSLIVDKLSQLTGTVIDEETRKSNENTRKSNELERIDNENTRKFNEEIRIQNENTRVQNENIRQTNEDTRIANENARVQAENVRAATFAGYEERVSTVEDDLVAHKAEMATNAHLAKNIGLQSVNFEANNVEDGMNELKQEIIDARQGETSLGANLQKIKENLTNLLEKELKTTLNELPNGVKDEIDNENNKIIQRTGETQLNGEKINQFITTHDQIDVISFKKPDDSYMYGKTSVEAFHTSTITGYEEFNTGFIENLVPWSYTVRGASHNIYIAFPKNEFSNIEEAKLYFNTNPLTLVYQLENRIEKKFNQLSGNTREIIKLINQLNDVKKQLYFSLINLIDNGDFKVSTGWSFSSALQGPGHGQTTDDYFIGAPQSMKGVVTSQTVNASFRNNEAFDWINNHKYYIVAHIKPKYNTETRIELGYGLEAPTNNIYVNELIPNQWNKISGVVKYKETNEVPKRFGVVHSTVGYDIGDPIYFDGFLVIDLTASFGEGEEPSVEEMDELLDELTAGWFEKELQVPLSFWYDRKINYLERHISTSNYDNLPLFSFRFDDGHSTNYTQGFPRLRDAGMKGSYFLTTDWIGEPGRVTETQIKEMVGAGHEIGSHSKSHPRFPTLTNQELLDELIQSKMEIEDIIGRECRSIAIPHGDYESRDDILTHSVYRNVITSKGYSGIYNYYGKMKNYHSIFIDARDFDWVKERIDMTIENKGWLILGIHNLRDLPVEDLGPLDTSIEVFQQTIDYIKSFMPDGAMVVTIDEGASIVRARK